MCGRYDFTPGEFSDLRMRFNLDKDIPEFKPSYNIAPVLTAALLRAMGYRTRITPKGPDRVVDVFASPNGLGFQEPRIKAEVKHRPKTSMGAQEVRSFIGGLREGERGLYVSSGGFTKEARYEAERSKVPITMLDLDELVSAIVTHYDEFDSDGRALLPLVRVYWPAAAS